MQLKTNPSSCTFRRQIQKIPTNPNLNQWFLDQTEILELEVTSGPLLHNVACTPAINPAPESRHAGSCFPAAYTPCSGLSLRPVHSAPVSQYPWDKWLTHSRESFRIQIRHEVTKYFKNRTLALSPPEVFSSLCLSKGLKAAQWRKQSTATYGDRIKSASSDIPLILYSFGFITAKDHNVFGACASKF